MLTTAIHRVEQFFWSEGLREIIYRAVLNGFHGELGRRKSSDHDHPHFWETILGFLEQFIAAHAAQSAIGYHHEIFVARLIEHLHGLLSGFSNVYRIAVIHQQLTHGRPHIGLIVDHQDGREGGFHDSFSWSRTRVGKVKMNSVPTPSSDSTTISPPYSSVFCFTIAKPSPVPFFLVVKYASKICSR